jgi:hypothetical protein
MMKLKKINLKKKPKKIPKSTCVNLEIHDHGHEIMTDRIEGKL